MFIRNDSDDKMRNIATDILWYHNAGFVIFNFEEVVVDKKGREH